MRIRQKCITSIRSGDAAAGRAFAALHGGLLLTQTRQSIRPLEAALDGALTNLRAHAA